ncbi:MAG TPA: purine-nucleoside phosphorylase [Longimicrobiales bacterium]|nr:purine-nucleoside phosphorylase [Longimicrobiales bacterium]
MSVAAAVEFLLRRSSTRPRVLLVLGSGLGDLVEQLDQHDALDFAEIPGFAAAGVEGHKGQWVSGNLEGVSCIVLQGRYHLYEGHSPETVVKPVRAAARLGVETMIATNAAGGMNPGFRPGDLMIIDDHVNLMWRNPLIGPVAPGEVRFPDMSAPYDRALQQLAWRVALERRLRVVSGTYVGVLGPSYETRAEIRCYSRFGDAIGMSTVPETIAARAGGMRVLGISLISNAAAGRSAQPLSHHEVIDAGKRAAGSIGSLIRGVVAALPTPSPRGQT